MQVLLAAKHPWGGRLKFGGVQTWQKTVADELVRRGHHVTFWGPELNLPCERFALGLVANLRHTAPALLVCEKVKKISHGIIPDEQGGDGWIFTSEEVQGSCAGTVIRQPLDLKFWQPGDCERIYLTHHGYRGELGCLTHLAKELGLEPIRIKEMVPEDVRKVLQRSRVVLATGRAAIEAMACGAAVVIADNRVYQAPLLDLDPFGAMHRNYSGRGGTVFTTDQLRTAIGLALERGSLRAHVETHHDAKRIVDQLCSD